MCRVHNLYSPSQHSQLLWPPQARPMHTHMCLDFLQRLCWGSSKVNAMPASSLALKVRRRGEEGHALIHDRLAHPQVVVQPLLHARGVAELLGLHTGTERQPVSLVAMLWALRGAGVWGRCSRAGGCGACSAVLCAARDWRQTYVRPVERRTPARKAETGEGSGSAKRLQSCWVFWFVGRLPSTASKA